MISCSGIDHIKPLKGDCNATAMPRSATRSPSNSINDLMKFFMLLRDCMNKSRRTQGAECYI